MAAITTVSVKGSAFKEQAQALSGATRDSWLLVPVWAVYAQVFLTPTTIGTSLQLSLKTVQPNQFDDAYAMQFKELAAFTAITGVNTTLAVDIGPGVTGIADDVVSAAAADSYIAINAVLPPILNPAVIAVGACVYDLTVAFRGQ